MTITEIGRMGVKPGLKVMDRGTEEGKLLAKIYDAIVDAPTGPRSAYLGLEVEDPSKIWAFFDWDTLSDHEKFAKEFGADFVQDLPRILTHCEFTKHIKITPFPPVVLDAPITELLLAYFPSDISAVVRDASSARMQQLIDEGLSKCHDVQGVRFGWGSESDFPVFGGEQSQTGSLLMACIGWPTVEAHMRFRETGVQSEYRAR